MPVLYQVRADFDATTIVVYQAYPASIAEPAIAAQRFVPPFSTGRMTWIKPSFLWLMERSNWATKPGQERVLGVRITRTGWDEALSLGILTHPEPRVYPDPSRWERAFAEAAVHVQWDPERSLRGAALGRYCIQVGLSRRVIERYVDEWVTEIRDLTPLVRKAGALVRRGELDAARRLLPSERPYPVPPPIAARLGMEIHSVDQESRSSRRQRAPRSREP